MGKSPQNRVTGSMRRWGGRIWQNRPKTLVNRPKIALQDRCIVGQGAFGKTTSKITVKRPRKSRKIAHNSVPGSVHRWCGSIWQDAPENDPETSVKPPTSAKFILGATPCHFVFTQKLTKIYLKVSAPELDPAKKPAKSRRNGRSWRKNLGRMEQTREI